MTGRVLAHKVARDLRAHRAQAVALAAVVALGITTFVALVGAYLDLSASQTRTNDELRFADVWFTLADAPDSVADDVARLPGVAAVEARLVVDTGLQLDGGVQARARVLSVPDGHPSTVNDVYLDTGTTRVPPPGTVLVSSDFATARHLQPGDTVSLVVDGVPARRTISGLVTSPEYLTPTPSRDELLPSPGSFAVVFMPVTDTQALFGRPGRVNDLAVRVDPGTDPTAVAATVAEQLADVEPSAPTFRRDQASYAWVQQDITMFRSLATAIPAIILVAGVLSVAAMLGRLVRSQQQHIGLMKALGYRDRAVAGHYVALALVVITAGAIVGVAAGSLLARVVLSFYASEVGVPLLRSDLHSLVAAGAVAVTLGLGLLAAFGPARRAAAMAPAAAMRLDPLAAAAAAGTPLGRLPRVPLRWRLPLRSVMRARRRTLSTGLGVTAALVLVLMVLGLRDGAASLITRVSGRNEAWDVTATFNTPQPAALATQIADWPGVEQIAPFIQVPVSVAGPAGNRPALLTAVDPAQRLHVLRLTGNTPPTQALGAEGIVLTSAMADDLGVALGDPVTVRTPIGTSTLRYTATADEAIPSLAYMSLATAQRVAGNQPVINGMYIAATSDQITVIQSRLYQLPGAASVKLRTELESDLREFLAIIDIGIAIMLTFALAMAFALLFNAMTINALERQREYATMRALGAPRRLITALFTRESITLWLLCLLPGALVGTWLARRLGEAVGADILTFPARITPASYIVTVAGVLATMLLAAAPAIHRINRLDLATATKVLT